MNVVITGATGQIGRVIAKEFARRGANLVLIDLYQNSKQLNELTSTISLEYKVQVMPTVIDIRDISAIKDGVESFSVTFPVIDILINNAGVNSLNSALQVTPEIWDQIVDTNLRGTFFMSQAIAPLMIKQKCGSIVNIASQHGIVGSENRAPYCASKAGLINLTNALSIEWAKYGIRVNCVSPTFVQSDKNKELLYSLSFKNENLSRIPLRRYAMPIDVANAAIFLSSSENNMITGHNLVVDGGWTSI
ncbi:SDR family oxidoreductase [Neobacillus sp. PS3-40]|uniref:SDR family NAD(P)-dependent oxidoreductase n=1 Tax=Neobacillus sp. PS3-40 TaxID=3070679 RepID=UPI0027E13B9A|nr:SDR family oxidoreductase [Neobacillus sp. PS3-40]WML46152.1 SDR family oxidoreductase [Neobacillus sp. PS3-40]